MKPKFAFEVNPSGLPDPSVQLSGFTSVATVQTYVLAKYNANVDKMIKEEFLSWKELMKECLFSVFGDEATDNDSEYMMILIAGVFICHYNGVLSENINDHLMDASPLFQK